MDMERVTAEERDKKELKLIDWREKKETNQVKQNLSKIANCQGIKGNYTLKTEPHEIEILRIAKEIEVCFGKLEFYQLWFAKSINSWRLVFYRH